MKYHENVPAGQEFFTPKESAAWLGMSHEWMRKKIQRRQIGIVKLGRSVRIPRSEIERLIESNTIPALEAR